MNVISHDAGARRFTAEVDGHRAQLDYALDGHVMTITHTRVPSPVRERGVAAQLMAAALEHAHAAHWTVKPACSYAAAYLVKRGQEVRQRTAPPAMGAAD